MIDRYGKRTFAVIDSEEEEVVPDALENDFMNQNIAYYWAVNALTDAARRLPDHEAYRTLSSTIETQSSELTETLSSSDIAPEEKVKAINNFEKNCKEACKNLPNTWKRRMLKAVTMVVGAAGGAVLGAAIGVGIGILAGGGTPLSLIFGFIGLVKGAITGASLGIAASSAVVGAASFYGTTKLTLFEPPLATDIKKDIADVVADAKATIKKQR